MMLYRQVSPSPINLQPNRNNSNTVIEIRCLDMAGLAYTDKTNGFPGGLVSIFLQVLLSGLSEQVSTVEVIIWL